MIVHQNQCLMRQGDCHWPKHGNLMCWNAIILHYIAAHDIVEEEQLLLTHVEFCLHQLCHDRKICLNYSSPRLSACCCCPAPALQCFCYTELRIRDVFRKKLLTCALVLWPPRPSWSIVSCHSRPLKLVCFHYFQKSIHLWYFHWYKMLTLQVVTLHNTCSSRATKNLNWLRCTSQEWSGPDKQGGGGSNPGPGAFYGLSFHIPPTVNFSRPFWGQTDFRSCCAYILLCNAEAHRILFEMDVITSAESYQVPFAH